MNSALLTKLIGVYDIHKSDHQGGTVAYVIVGTSAFGTGTITYTGTTGNTVGGNPAYATCDRFNVYVQTSLRVKSFK